MARPDDPAVPTLDYATTGGARIANRAASASAQTALSAVIAGGFAFIANNSAPFFFVASGVLAIATLVLGVIALRNTRNPGVVGRRTAIAAIIFGAVGSCAIAAGGLAVYAVHLSYERSNRTKCAANLRQIHAGITLYAKDHAGLFPPRFDLLISHADINPMCFICPSSSDDTAYGHTLAEIIAEFNTKGHCSFIYRGGGLTSSSATPSHVLAHEPLENHQRAGIHVLYADGRVVWVSPSAARRLIQELDAGRNPPKP